MYTHNSVWGQRAAVAEPAVNSAGATIGLIAIDGQVTGQQRPGPGGIPETRDWTVYLQATGNTSRLLAPNVQARVTFGSGASAFTRTMRIPSLGAVLHVVSTALSVNALVMPSGAAPNGDITVQAFASPGRPSRTRVMLAINVASYTLGEFVELPPFTTAIQVYASLPGSLGTADVSLEYNGLGRGAYTPAAPYGQWGTVVAVPRDVNGFSLTNITPGATFVNVMCEVDG